MHTQKQSMAAQNGEAACLGIEFGSTRIKAVLVGSDHRPVAYGSCLWENRLADGIWTYDLEDVWRGVRTCLEELKRDAEARRGLAQIQIGAIGVSAMMHGYLAFDADGELLVPFRTWRNTCTKKAAEELTERLDFPIPQRWSAAHLYQAILDGETHVKNVAFLTTLAGYVHWRLTGEKVLGIGDASGMFPIDKTTCGYDEKKLRQFDELAFSHGFRRRIQDVLPRVLTAGQFAGTLTPEGARLLDPDGWLQAGIAMCPPEGDAGTGMTATNSVRERTCSLSAGTSVFAMTVLERPLKRTHPEIDLVATPEGGAVAMVHCNNGTGDLDAWIELLGEAAEKLGARFDKTALYRTLFQQALCADGDCGGLTNVNYLSGEHLTGFTEGRPVFARLPGSRLTLANFMRAQLFSVLCTLKTGMDILTRGEDVVIEEITAHGGYFKVKGVGQRILAAALDTPVCIRDAAGEGGPWGMALLAAYMLYREEGEPLGDYLENRVFRDAAAETAAPDPAEAAGFSRYLERYRRCLIVEQTAIETLKDNFES